MQSVYDSAEYVFQGVEVTLKVLKGRFCHKNFLTLFWGQEEILDIFLGFNGRRII